jgi:hypothetical protein
VTEKAFICHSKGKFLNLQYSFACLGWNPVIYDSFPARMMSRAAVAAAACDGHTPNSTIQIFVSVVTTKHAVMPSRLRGSPTTFDDFIKASHAVT